MVQRKLNIPRDVLGADNEIATQRTSDEMEGWRCFLAVIESVVASNSLNSLPLISESSVVSSGSANVPVLWN